MKTERKKQTMTLSILVVAVLVISVGFAAFSTTLRIRSSAKVNPNANTFMVKFSTTQNTLIEAAVVPSSKTSGITATNGTINNTGNPTLSNLSAEFKQPGDYVEYKFYARNEGEFLAYLTNINYVGETACVAGSEATDSYVQEACKAMNVKVTVGGTTYNNTSTVTGHTLAKNTGEEVKVRIEYGSNGAVADGPFTVTFGDISLIYSTADEQVEEPPVEEPPVEDETFYTGTIYRYSTEHLAIGGDIASLGKYETTVANISQNYYLKHDVVNNIVTASYACITYTEDGVRKEACIQGGNSSYYETNQATLRSVEGYFNTLSNGSCDFGDFNSYCRSDSWDLTASSAGQVYASDRLMMRCNVSSGGDSYGSW